MGVLRRLADEARRARRAAGVRQLDVGEAAGVSTATVSRFETTGHAEGVEELVEAYEQECGLAAEELWRRAVCP